tara:strand:- start:240 stop:761 length:522 start_codon:yes stop_codon:yes gene_type:complete
MFNFRKLRALYLLNFKVRCIREGISDRFAEVEFMDVGLHSGIVETSRTALVEKLQNWGAAAGNGSVHRIKVKPLAYWLEQFPKAKYSDFISLDVEGHELTVLSGIDKNSLRAKILLIESDDESQAVIKKMAELGYEAILKNKYNMFFCRDLDALQCSLEEIVKSYPSYKIMDN